MSSFAILTDSTSDLKVEFQEKYEIEVIQGHIILPDKTDVISFQKWEKFNREDFYNDLKANPDGYSTAPPSVGEFAKAFEEHIKKGEDVLCITISSGISGAYGFALQAKDLVIEKYPDAKIMVVDSLRYGPGFGLLSVHASMKRAEGLSMTEVFDYVEAHKNEFHQAGWLDDLSFVAKKGRLTHAKAFFGTLAGVKPIGENDYNGLTTVLGKAKGAKQAYAVLLEYMEKTIVNPEEQIIFIAQTNRYDQAVKYREMIIEKFHPKDVVINDVFPTCGINIGPGLMAAFYMGTPISKDLSVEREIIEKALGNN